MDQWITLSQAATATNLDEPTLRSYIDNKSSSIKLFKQAGLLFDRQRYSKGEDTFLQLLNQASTGAEADSTQLDRSYDWEETPIKVTLMFQPANGESSDRTILITATTHDDMPLAELVTEADLGSLPPLIESLLDRLSDDLGNRLERYRQVKARSPESAKKSATQPKPTSANAKKKPSATTSKTGGGAATQQTSIF
jgi:hypothetical protein